jgi:hypothetical protein
MTVYDLIQELMKHPMSLDVVIDAWDGEFSIHNIEDAEERLIDCKESECGDVLAQIKCVVLKIE